MQFWPVDETNDVRAIAVHPKFCAVNVTMQVDLLGQCASGSLGSHYVSSTGGQADFMRGAAYSEGGQSFIVTHATAVNGTISRIQPTLTPGAVVTTHKNLVDKVVTEHGRGRAARPDDPRARPGADRHRRAGVPGRAAREGPSARVLVTGSSLGADAREAAARAMANAPIGVARAWYGERRAVNPILGGDR